MRFRFFYLAAWSLAISALPAFSACAAEDECWRKTAIDPMRVLVWSPEEQLCGYQNMEKLWPANTAAKGAKKTSPLPRAKELSLPSAEAFMRRNGVRGMLVIHDGTVVLEKYRDVFGPDKRWTSFSMAKSITSVLAGAAVKDGSIKSLDDPVTRYLPELQGGGYDGVTVRQLLTMTSGVRWNENYRDPKSDVARLVNLADTTQPVLLGYMAKLPRAAKPGTLFNYSTGEANLSGHLVRRATGKSLAAYLSEKIWSREGMEMDAFWSADRMGSEVSGCCFNAAMRDYGRIGLLMLREGTPGKNTLLPNGWVKEATTASAPARVAGRSYGYQWWVRDGGSYQASGIFGQMLHVDPARKLVIVMLGAWELPTGTAELHQERRVFVAAIKKAADASKEKNNEAS